MRLVEAMVIVVCGGCAAEEPLESHAYAWATSDGQSVTIGAHVLDQNMSGTQVREHEFADDQKVVTTFRGEQLEMTRLEHAEPSFPRHYYSLTIEASVPTEETLRVEVTNDNLHADLLIPVAFTIAGPTLPKVQLPVVVEWNPPAAERMRWTVNGSCLPPDGFGPIDVLRGDDVTLVDEGSLEIPDFQLAYDCDLTLTVERYRGSGVQQRSVTFRAAASN